MLKPLTGLRFLAALHVVFVHLLVIGDLQWLPPALTEIATRGYMAVPLFFVLSGFVLTYTYCGTRRIASSQPINKREFWAARFARIYPVYALSLLLALPTFFNRDSLTHPLQALGVVVPVVAMVQAWFPLLAQAWLSPAWSLSAEAFFYLLFPFVIPRILGIGRGKLTTSLALLWVASVAAPIAWLFISPNGDGETGTVRWQWAMAIYFGPLPHLPEFLTGVVLGRIFLARRASPTHASAIRPSTTIWLSAVTAMCLVAYVVAAYAGGGDLPRMLSHTGIFLPIYAALVYCLAFGGGVVGRLLATRPMLLLGEASYGLYLLHFPAFWWTERLVRRSPAVNVIFGTPWLYPLIEVLVAVGVSVAVYLAVERPSRRVLRRVFMGHVHVAESAASTPVGIGIATSG